MMVAVDSAGATKGARISACDPTVANPSFSFVRQVTVIEEVRHCGKAGYRAVNSTAPPRCLSESRSGSWASLVIAPVTTPSESVVNRIGRRRLPLVSPAGSTMRALSSWSRWRRKGSSGVRPEPRVA